MVEMPVYPPATLPVMAGVITAICDAVLLPNTLSLATDTAAKRLMLVAYSADPL